MLVNVISFCDWVFTSFSALPDTLLVIWFAKIIALNMEHSGALGVEPLQEVLQRSLIVLRTKNHLPVSCKEGNSPNFSFSYLCCLLKCALYCYPSYPRPPKSPSCVLPNTITGVIHKSITRLKSVQCGYNWLRCLDGTCAKHLCHLLRSAFFLSLKIYHNSFNQMDICLISLPLS